MGQTSLRGRRRASRHDSQTPWVTDATARVAAKAPGISLAQAENAPMTPRIASEPTTHRDGRHSRRQGAHALDERGEFDIGSGFMAKEPAPKPIVFAIQQP